MRIRIISILAIIPLPVLQQLVYHGFALREAEVGARRTGHNYYVFVIRELAATSAINFPQVSFDAIAHHRPADLA